MDDCICPACISACKRDPGRLVPEDLKKIADFLNMSESELIATSLVRLPVWLNQQRIELLAPVKKKGRRFLVQPGSLVPDYYEGEKGTCIFLDSEERCTIHPVRPFECRAYMGCRHTFLGRRYRAAQVRQFFVSRWRRYRRPW